MNYIILAAGKGTRLHPLTKTNPKCLYFLDENVTVIKALVQDIKTYDKNANVIVVTGFMNNMVREAVDGVTFVQNPFYEVTNSIASVWFAKDYLQGHVTLINSDIIIEKKLMETVVVKEYDYPSVLLDSSIKNDGDYNVQIKDDHVVVMSKELKNYYGEYAGITKLNPNASSALKEEIDRMVQSSLYDQWYENALVQLIFNNNFLLRYIDVTDYSWTEIDVVDDLLKAKEIYSKDSKK